MHDRRPLGLGQLLGERRGERVDLLHALDPRRVPLLAPPAQLPGHVAVRPPELAKPHGFEVHRVQRREHVDQAVRERSALRCGVGVAGRELRGDDVPLDPLHHVERLSQHVGVTAEVQHARHRHGRALQPGHHPELAAHVVRRRQHVSQRRATEHEGARRGSRPGRSGCSCRRRSTRSCSRPTRVRRGRRQGRARRRPDRLLRSCRQPNCDALAVKKWVIVLAVAHRAARIGRLRRRPPHQGAAQGGSPRLARGRPAVPPAVVDQAVRRDGRVDRAG